jgi:hypothetical protein
MAEAVEVHAVAFQARESGAGRCGYRSVLAASRVAIKSSQA